MKIRIRASLYFFSYTFFVTVILGLFGYFIVRNIARERSQEQLTALAAVQEARLEEAIEKNIERIKGVSSRTKLRNSIASLTEIENEDEKEEVSNTIRRIIGDARVSIDDFIDVLIIDTRGIVIASTNRDFEGDDYSTKDFYEDAKIEEQVTFQKIENEAALCLIGPMFLEEKYLGQVFIVSRADSIRGIVNDYEGMSETGETVLAQRTVDGGIEFLIERRFEDEVLQDSLVNEAGKTIAMFAALQGREEFLDDNIDYRGKEIFAVSHYLEKTKWGVVVKIDKVEALGHVTEFLRQFLFIITVTIFFAFSSAWLLSGSVSRPLRQLATAIKEFELGRYEDIGETKRKDEVGDLQRAFKSMAKSINDSKKQVEMRVEERTKELEQLNKIMINRELKMIELKKELAKLKQANEAKK